MYIIDSYLNDRLFNFDVLILAGFTGRIFSHSIFENTKLIVLHCGARLMDDIFRSTWSGDNEVPSFLLPRPGAMKYGPFLIIQEIYLIYQLFIIQRMSKLCLTYGIQPLSTLF